MKESKKLVAMLLSCALVVGMTGCSAAVMQQGQASNGQTDANTETTEEREPDLSFSKRDKDPSYDEATATKIDLTGSGATVSGDGAVATGSTVTISADGTYIVKGSLTSGQILVDLPGDEDKAQIVLDGATIHNETGPAIYVRQSDKVFVTLAEGSTNELTDGADYVAIDDGNEPKATLYSKDDLVINGSGTLNVTGSYYHGVASTNDLKVTGGIISVTSKEDAFHGKDAIKIGGGDITVNAGDDAFHSEYLFYIEDGIVNVESCTEGYEAQKVYIYGGDSSIVARDDGVNAAAPEEETADGASDDATSSKVDGGVIPDRTSDQRTTGEKARTMPKDSELPPLSEEFDPSTLPNGAPGERPSGELLEFSNGAPAERPDGANAQDMPQPSDGMGPQDANQGDQGRGRGGFGGFGEFGGVMSGASEDCLIRINGGTLRVDAGGDGLDSNGSIEINGGTVLVSGESSADDSGLDYEFDAIVNGGDIVLVGAAAMAEDFTGGTQAHLMERLNGSAGSTVEVKDASGNVLVSYTVPKAFQAVTASAPNCSSITVR